MSSHQNTALIAYWQAQKPFGICKGWVCALVIQTDNAVVSTLIGPRREIPET